MGRTTSSRALSPEGQHPHPPLPMSGLSLALRAVVPASRCLWGGSWPCKEAGWPEVERLSIRACSENSYGVAEEAHSIRAREGVWRNSLDPSQGMRGDLLALSKGKGRIRTGPRGQEWYVLSRLTWSKQWLPNLSAF